MELIYEGHLINISPYYVFIELFARYETLVEGIVQQGAANLDRDHKDCTLGQFINNEGHH